MVRLKPESPRSEGHRSDGAAFPLRTGSVHVLIELQRWPRPQSNAGGSTGISATPRSVLLGFGFLNLLWNIDDQCVTINLVLSHY
jgi:hypothetical protein